MSDQESNQGSGAPIDPSRRRALKIGIGVLGAGAAAIPAVPALGYLAHPLFHEITTSGGAFIDVGPRTQFSADVPVKVDLYTDRRDAWVVTPKVKVGSCWVLERDSGLVAYSSVCPHLGCAVDFDAAAGAFKCPCHRSEFDLNGAPIHGPSPRPLDTLALETEPREATELVKIRFQRFRQGIREKVEV